MSKWKKWMIIGSVSLLLIATIILLCFYWKSVFNENVAVIITVIVLGAFVGLGTWAFYRIKKQ